MSDDTRIPGTVGPLPALGEPVDSLLGAELGSWQVLRRIGGGGMGAVYLVEHRTLRNRAAAKFLHQHLLADADSVSRFHAEAQGVSRLSHPNIVSVFDFGTMPGSGRPWFVMEYLEGVTLDAELGRGVFSLERLFEVVTQIGSALERAHASGVVHRDLKPANVMVLKLGRTDFVKVVDFGIAKLRDIARHRTMTGMVIGTPDYMAPEQILGHEVDARTDVYALGAMAYELLIGQPPFGTRKLTQILAAHLEEPAPSPAALRADVSPGVAQAILKALAKKPEERFQTAPEFAEALRQTKPTPMVTRATPLPVSSLEVSTRRGTLHWQGERVDVECLEESSRGCFVVTRLELQLLEELDLELADELLRVQVVRRTAASATRDAGFYLQFLALTPRQRVKLDGAGTEDEVATEEALEAWRARLWGDAYSALGISPEASMAKVALAFAGLDAEVAAIESRKMSQARRHDVAAARERLTETWQHLGEPAARARYDARRSNWRGVRECLAAGLSREALDTLRSEHLSDEPDAHRRGLEFSRLARAELDVGRLEAAVERLQQALVCDPLNGVLHETWRLIVTLLREFPEQ